MSNGLDILADRMMDKCKTNIEILQYIYRMNKQFLIVFFYKINVILILRIVYPNLAVFFI